MSPASQRALDSACLTQPPVIVFSQPSSFLTCGSNTLPHPHPLPSILHSKARAIFPNLNPQCTHHRPPPPAPARLNPLDATVSTVALSPPGPNLICSSTLFEVLPPWLREASVRWLPAALPTRWAPRVCCCSLSPGPQSLSVGGAGLKCGLWSQAVLGHLPVM